MSDLFSVYFYIFYVNSEPYQVSAECLETPVQEGKEIYIKDLGDLEGDFIFKSGAWEEIPQEHPGFGLGDSSGVLDFLNQHLKEGFTL